MSSITSPILLDSTGKETNEILKNISNSLLAANTLIDDTLISDTRVWSSEKLVRALTISEEVSGVSSVVFDAIESTPLEVITKISKAPISVEIKMISSNNKEASFNYLVPVNGTYNWTSGLVVLEDGTETSLAKHFITSLGGATTLAATNVDSIKVKYRTIAKQSGGTANFDIIDGGSANEEA